MGLGSFDLGKGLVKGCRTNGSDFVDLTKGGEFLKYVRKSDHPNNKCTACRWLVSHSVIQSFSHSVIQSDAMSSCGVVTKSLIEFLTHSTMHLCFVFTVTWRPAMLLTVFCISIVSFQTISGTLQQKRHNWLHSMPSNFLIRQMSFCSELKRRRSWSLP